MNWKDIPAAYKIASAGITVAALVVGWMFATFETAAGAEQKWSAHNQAIQCRTVYEIEAEIEKYAYQLRFGADLTQADKDWIKLQIERLREKVRRIDPQGKC